MNYNLSIQRILLELERQHNPEDRITLLKQGIHIADANNDLDWGFDLRMYLIHAEQYTNHSRESIPAFAWVLQAHDANPSMFDEEDILREYKWLAGVVYNNLQVSLEQIDNILEDFRRRSLENGYTSREYYNIKCNQALFMGDKAAARDYLQLRDKEPMDATTSESSDLIGTIYVEMFEDNFDSAIAHIKEFVAQRSVHQMNVIPVYSGLIYYLGGKQYDERIDSYFDEADEEFSTLTKYSFQLYEISLMMYYMAKHRTDRAWEYFEQFVNWEIDAEESVRFDFALSILPLFKNGGMHTISAFSSQHPYYQENNNYNLSHLYTYYQDLARDLAQQFDTRNRNTHYSELFEEELAYLAQL
ncbi:MAG: hypothetical protein RL662_326 [Bacteroidota bacterium]|jgi:hypothetical protein